MSFACRDSEYAVLAILTRAESWYTRFAEEELAGVSGGRVGSPAPIRARDCLSVRAAKNSDLLRPSHLFPMCVWNLAFRVTI